MSITVGSLGRLIAVEQRGGDVVFSFESSELILTPLLPNAVRHTWMPRHWRLYTEPVAEQYAVQRQVWPRPQFTVVETAATVEVRSGELLIEATRNPFHLRYSTNNGATFLEEMPGGGLRWSYWDYELRFMLAPEDHFYGIGQVDQLEEPVDLDHRGHRREVWNQHSPPATTVLPALYSLRGYGLLIDNPRRATWDLGNSDPSTFSYRAGGGGLQYYVFFGPDLPRIARTYFELTGFPPMPPRWVLGLLQSRYGYRSRTELESIAKTFRDKTLPCDALILDVYWFKYMGDLAFNVEDWPDAPGMIDYLHDQGFRIILIEEPYITTQSRDYAEALSKGYLAKRYDGSAYTFDFWPGECALIDFSNPAARAWWTAKHRPLLGANVDGWWADLNEPAKHYQDMCHYAGSAPMVHNLVAYWIHDCIFEAVRRYKPEQRAFVLSRSAFAGSQRYGVSLWSGDVDMTFAALRKQITVGLSAGLAGFPLWGSDIGGFGFGGKCGAELYVRWFEFGAFCGLFRPHGDQTELREPWQFGPEVEEICRRYLKLRYQMLPYIYSVMRLACTTGVPIMRALVMEFSDDHVVVNLSDEYMFGSELLVAPITEDGATNRRVYLPAGRWIDYWNENQVDGPGWIDVAAPLDRIPLFVRAGGIIPSGPDVQYSSQRSLDPLTVEIYRGASRSFTMYEDDGESIAYQRGDWTETTIAVTERGSNELTCRIASRGKCDFGDHERTLIISIHCQPMVEEVSCDEKSVAPLDDAESIGLVPTGWCWEERRGLLKVKLKQRNRTLVIRIS